MSRSFGMFFLRALLGVIVLMQGWGKVVTWGIPKIYEMWFKDFEKTSVPGWLLWSTAYFTSYVELIAGVLLITGLYKKIALYLLALDLLIVSFGHGLLEPIWDLQHVFPRGLLVAALLILPEAWDKWTFNPGLKKQN